MNFSLHLQTIFTFIRQNKASSEGKKTHTHIQELHYTFACYILEFNDWICSGWKVYWKHSPCTCTYIHISRAVKLSDVANTCFLLFHIITFLFRLKPGYNCSNIRSQYSHFSSLVTTSLQLSFWLLGCYTGWGKSMPGQECVSECLCCVHSYSWATETVLLDDHLVEPMEPCWSNT